MMIITQSMGDTTLFWVINISLANLGHFATKNIHLKKIKIGGNINISITILITINIKH
jgi:hypothetical protein